MNFYTIYGTNLGIDEENNDLFPQNPFLDMSFNLNDQNTIDDNLNIFLSLGNQRQENTKTTKYQTEDILNKNKLFTTKIDEKKDNQGPEFYSLNDISNTFNKESITINFNIKELAKDDFKEDLQLISKKSIDFDNLRSILTKTTDFPKELIKNNNLEWEDQVIKNKKRGRPKDTESERETHNKMSPDNIIKKSKVIIFKYSLLFLNNILKNSYPYYKIELLKLKYEYINRLQKDQELEFLNMSLKELYSKDISPKYNKNHYPDYNKRIIEKIINNEPGDTILFAFNITLRDWLDIFTYKKNVKDLLNEKYENFQNVDIEKVEKSLVRVDSFLNIFYEKDNEHYMKKFLFYLYNYERWFYLKRSRNRESNKILKNN